MPRGWYARCKLGARGARGGRRRVRVGEVCPSRVPSLLSLPCGPHSFGCSCGGFLVATVYFGVSAIYPGLYELVDLVGPLH